MPGRSLRDELLSGRRRGRKKRVKWPWVIAVLVVAIALLAGYGASVVGDDRDPRKGDASLRSAEPSASGGREEESSEEEGVPVEEDAPAAAEEVPDPGSNGAASADSSAVRKNISALEVVEPRDVGGYERELFGQAWYDEDRNGCDTRNDILGRDLEDVEYKPGTRDCKVLGGVLDDWYSGRKITFTSGSNTSRLVQIDHVVPLSWAWKHGANTWSDETRRRFANDPVNLNASDDQENMRKSDSGPGTWMPSNDKAACRYVQRFALVLKKYDLGIDLRDRAMMRGVLDECDAGDAFGPFLSKSELKALRLGR